MAESVVSLGGVPHLTTMLMSSHVRMLNEALIALTVMAAVLGEDAVQAQGRDSTVARHLVLLYLRGIFSHFIIFSTKSTSQLTPSHVIHSYQGHSHSFTCSVSQERWRL